jgi:hypothetical protein
VRFIGKYKLGFGPDDVGLHSIRSGASMTMYLGTVPVFTILLIGRWSSNALLQYTGGQGMQHRRSLWNGSTTIILYNPGGTDDHGGPTPPQPFPELVFPLPMWLRDSVDAHDPSFVLVT